MLISQLLWRTLLAAALSLGLVNYYLVVFESFRGTDAIVNASKVDVSLEQDTVKWVRWHGGFFSPKQEITSKDGVFGVYTSRPVKKGEVLTKIPWKLIIDADDFPYRGACNSRLAAELRKGEDSFFAPYLRRFLSPEHYNPSLLPALWSDQGKELLGLIFGNDHLPPKQAFTMIFNGWEKQCRNLSFPIRKLVFQLYITHLEDLHGGKYELFIPLQDLTNHCGGEQENVYFEVRKGKSFKVKALRDIEEGEMICHDYYGENRSKQYGTPELFRDYGFVESLPQRWKFHHVGFELDEYNEVMWHDKSKVTRENIKHIEKDLKRLKNWVRHELERTAPIVPTNEMTLIWQYYNALIEAMERAIAASPIPARRFVVSDAGLRQVVKSTKKRKKDGRRRLSYAAVYRALSRLLSPGRTLELRTTAIGSISSGQKPGKVSLYRQTPMVDM